MTTERLDTTQTYKAAADLSSNYGFFLRQTAARTAGAITAKTQSPVGALLNKPSSAGAEASVCKRGRVELVASAAIAAGAKIGPSANGRAETKTPGSTSGEYYCGEAVTAASAAGEYIVAEIHDPVYLA